MLVGYARVSTPEQNLDLQESRLTPQESPGLLFRPKASRDDSVR
jgi:hypothetical protein